MKRNIAIALFALSTLGAAASAVAQQAAVQATVPFEFSVGGQLLPADTYTITSHEGILTVRGADRHIAAQTTALRGREDATKGSQLVFDKYGNQYFLHQIVCSNYAEMNANIPKSKLEKRVQMQEAKLGGAEPVLVAAK